MIIEKIKSFIKKIMRYKLIIVIILIIALILIFTNLDNSYLWLDESITASLAVNTFKFGYPKVWDGINMLSYWGGNDFNNYFTHTATNWLQFYVCAPFIKLFGRNTYGARFIFAVFGFFTVIIVWFLAKKLFNSIAYANLTTLCLILYVPFLLYTRQCRYYSLVLFFTSLSTLLYFKILETEKIKWNLSIFLALSICGIFHSNFLACAVWCFAVGLHLLFFNKIKIWIKFIFPFILGLSLSLIWFIYAMLTSNSVSYSINNVSDILLRFLVGLWKIQVYFFPFITLSIIALIVSFIKKNKVDENENKLFSPLTYFFLFLILSNIIFVAIPNFFLLNHYYLTPVIASPFLIVIFFRWLYRINKKIATIILFCIMTTNIFNIMPYYVLKIFNNNSFDSTPFAISYMRTYDKHKTIIGIISSPDTRVDFQLVTMKKYLANLKIESYLINFVKELVSDYDSPIEEIVGILKEKGNKNDLVIVKGLEHEGIIYYTGMKIVNILHPDKVALSGKNPNARYSFLTDVPDDKIDWIILRNEGLPLTLHDKNYLKYNIEKYEIIKSKTIDMPLSNCPDLDYHRFVTETEGEKFFILHRKK